MENEKIVNEVVENEVIEETVEEQLPAELEKPGFMQGLKNGVSKAWNSKPAKVIKKAGLVVAGIGIGVVGTMLLSGGSSEECDDSDETEVTTEVTFEEI